MKNLKNIHAPKLRSGQASTKLNQKDFKAEFAKRFFDPNFNEIKDSLDKVIEVAWQNYSDHRKAPLTSAAGPGFADAKYQLSDQWRETSDKLKIAQKKFKSKKSKSRILLINASPRNEHTCPGEVSKSFLLTQKMKKVFTDAKFEVDYLDLSLLTAEFGKNIYPCKACVSTAMPLCHWPCSCYPNNSLGQTNDWMAEIYERWVLAHGVLIVTPVHWYQAPSTLKLMMDRLVCADGGSPDPTLTQGKNAILAKKIELAGWDYPKHLKGRCFSIVVHGDTVGAESVRRNLTDWLHDLELNSSSSQALLDGYIGYWEPYATSHDALDKDKAFQIKALNAAHSLVHSVKVLRKNNFKMPDSLNLKNPSPK